MKKYKVGDIVDIIGVLKIDRKLCNKIPVTIDIGKWLDAQKTIRKRVKFKIVEL